LTTSGLQCYFSSIMLYKQHWRGRTAAFALLSIAAASAQKFDVASVKPLPTSAGLFTMNGGPGTADPARISFHNVPLRRVLLEAYPVRNYQLIGPDWLNSLRYDIDATIPPGTTKAQFQAMLQNLLVARFQMVVRRESREMPVYALLVAKAGLKVRESALAATGTPPDQLAVVQKAEGKDGFPVVSMRSPGVVIETINGRARVTAKDVSMAKFTDFLTGQAGRPVLDKTGLTGVYTFELYFTPESAISSDSPEPAIYGALEQQLGLRLEARKEPVEMLVIDRAEKVPTGN